MTEIVDTEFLGRLNHALALETIEGLTGLVARAEISKLPEGTALLHQMYCRSKVANAIVSSRRIAGWRAVRTGDEQ